MKQFFADSLLVIALAIAACVFYAIGVNAQFLPPPPASQMANADPSFTDKDRTKLNAIYRMTRAMHTRLFPLSEEQKILNGGTVE